MSKPRTLAIIQARMGSSRLPGKMLLPIIDGKGPLELMLERVGRSTRIDQLVVATSTAAADDVLVARCRELGVPCFRGSENDVLDRVYHAAIAFGRSDAVVRLTGDCPLHDHRVIDLVIAGFYEASHDYFANVNPPTFPDGLDTEVMTFAALERAWREADLKSERGHVTLHIRHHPERFSVGNLCHSRDLSHFRFTLDESRDLALIREIFGRLYPGRPDFSWEEVLALLREKPEIMAINQGIERNEGLKESLANDGKVK